jgi:NitT/TauT family transport system substrate-binding protein
MKLTIRALLASLTLTATAPASAAPTAAAIRVGTNRSLGTVAPYVGRAKGLFASRGIAVDIVDFQDGSTLLEAFAAGQIDVALQGIAPAAIWQARGVPLKVIAGANGGGHVLLTRDDAGIASISGLRGRIVATPKPGTVVDTLFRAHIAKELAHLDPERDMTIIPGVAPVDMPAALLVAREVDAAITWEPFASQAETRFKNARVLFDASAEWRKLRPGKPLYVVNVVIARQDFIDRRKDDLRQFLAAYEEAVDFINASPDEANRIIASEVKLDVRIVAVARRRVEYGSRVDVPAALATLDWSKQLGYLKTIPVASALFDLSLLPPPSAKAGKK